MIDRMSMVVIYLVNPREKYWGRLEELSAIGVHVRGLELGVTEPWAREIARGETQGLGVATVFFPLSRVERICLDEDVGAVRSIRVGLENILGRGVAELLG